MSIVLSQIIFYSHLLGFAALAGGLLAQLTAPIHKITGVIVNGARWQFVSGVALVALAPTHYKMAPIAIKLAIVLVILGISEALRKRASISKSVYWTLLVLVIIQTAVAMMVTKDSSTIVPQ